MFNDPLRNFREIYADFDEPFDTRRQPSDIYELLRRLGVTPFFPPHVASPTNRSPRPQMDYRFADDDRSWVNWMPRGHMNFAAYDDGETADNYRLPQGHMNFPSYGSEPSTDPDPAEFDSPGYSPDPSAKRLRAQRSKREAFERLRKVLDERPEQQSMLPRPGITGIMALLSALSNNRYRPDDSPLRTFLGAYQGTMQDAYQRNLSKWQKDYERAKNDYDDYMSRAEDYENEYSDDKAEMQRRRQEQELTSRDDKDYRNANDDAIWGLPEYMRPYAPGISGGMKRSESFLKQADDDERKWNESGLQGPPMHDWQRSAAKGALTPAQQELGEALLRSEMLQHMMQGFNGRPLTSGERRSLTEMRSQYAKNQALVEKLFGKNQFSPKTSERQAILAKAREAIEAGADEREVLNRMRGLLLGLQHPDSKDGYYDYLMTSHGMTPNQVPYSYVPDF